MVCKLLKAIMYARRANHNYTLKGKIAKYLIVKDGYLKVKKTLFEHLIKILAEHMFTPETSKLPAHFDSYHLKLALMFSE